MSSHGFPPSEMHADIRDRFIAKVRIVDDETSCWEWMSRGFPYGRIYRPTGRRGAVALAAHRVAWEVANGQPVPAGLHVLHSCDNPICVRPDHLRPGTRADNMHDASVRGRARSARGEDSPRTKLTEADALGVIAYGHATRALAKELGVNRSALQAILAGRSWRHLPRPAREVAS